MTGTLRWLSVGSATLEPAFSAYVLDYECEVVIENGNAGGRISAGVQDGQIYTVDFGTGGTADSGALIGKTTNLGQKTYTLKGGTGGTEIAAADLPAGYVSGTRADIPLVITVTQNSAVVTKANIMVHRTYLEPDEETAVETAG